MDSEGVRLKKQCTAPLKEPPSKEQTQRTAWDQASEGHCRGALSTSTLQPTKHTCRSCDERRASIQMRQTGPCTEIPLTRYCRLAVAACKLADMKLRKTHQRPEATPVQGTYKATHVLIEMAHNDHRVWEPENQTWRELRVRFVKMARWALEWTARGQKGGNEEGRRDARKRARRNRSRGSEKGLGSKRTKQNEERPGRNGRFQPWHRKRERERLAAQSSQKVGPWRSRRRAGGHPSTSLHLLCCALVDSSSELCQGTAAGNRRASLLPLARCLRLRPLGRRREDQADQNSMQCDRKSLPGMGSRDLGPTPDKEHDGGRRSG